MEFRSEVSAEREAIIGQVLRLMAENTLAAVQEACLLHSAWLDRFPDDYAMLDLGGSLWMLADAIEAAPVESVKVELALDPSLLAWFQAQGQDYERRMLAALRLYAEAHQAAV